MFSQKEAKAFESEFVYAQHILLGLIAEEDRSSDGFLGSGVTIEKARETVLSIFPLKESTGDDYEGSSVSSRRAVPFSFGTKRVFEAAVEYSKSLGHKFVAPEHIFVALVKVDDGTTSRILYRYQMFPFDIWTDIFGSLLL